MRLSAAALVLCAAPALAQTSPEQAGRILSKRIQSSELAEFQLKQYLFRHVPRPAAPQTADQWTAQAKRTREHLLNDVIFHGWPPDWIHAPLKLEEAGVIETGKGYRMRKIRYEIVPGFWTSAIVYEPERLSGKVPAVLNPHGHGRPGKAFEFKQKRCINYALRGMIALSPEWPAFGELTETGNLHEFAAHLELIGANGVGLFYLGMRKGLDYLYDHPHVDRSRLAMTGLSGGGWQTIVLSALDERVRLSIPVAGYEPLSVNIVHPRDTDDVEQEASDFRQGQDYTHLTALLAPRPALLIFNVEDDCCFRAPMVKEEVFDRIRPFYDLYGKSANFAWHENLDPGSHNYQLDNRQQSYAFLAKHFGLSAGSREIPVDDQVRSVEELTVGLPKHNLTILEVARQFAAGIHRETLPLEAGREKLRSVVRYRPLDVDQAWMVDNSKNKGLETRSYRFLFSDGLAAAGVWLKAMSVPEDAPVTVLLHDKGRGELRAGVSDRLNRGEQVLALDVLLNGDSRPQNPAEYTLLLASIGDRPLGMEAAQLIAATQWLTRAAHARSARLEAAGMRSQALSLVAAAASPRLYSEVVVHDGIPSLARLLSEPVKYGQAPDLFCQDLYRFFDLDTIAALAAPARVTQVYK
jgi:hypothetical protein